MSAEKIFKRWMTVFIILFVSLFAYIVVADRHAPLTTEGRVQSYVIQVAPEVSGVVKEVTVSNNQRVKKGDLLVSIEQEKFKLALEGAKINLRSARDKEAMLKLEISVARAKILRAKASRDHAYNEFLRVNKMHERQLASESLLEDAESEFEVAQAELKAEQEHLKVISAELGWLEGTSTHVLRALNKLKKAELDLVNTSLVAPSDGVVTNLQVQKGTTAKLNSPLLTFVSNDQMWVTADFREKSLVNLGPNSNALVTFDALPGKVFEFNFKSQDFGVSVVQQNPDGSLTSVEANNRWVRDAQRARVHFSSIGDMPNGLFIGSRATVTFYPDENAFWRTVAKSQITLFSWFHFVY